MSESFCDERGVIRDLLTERIDSVTEIFTKTGAIRGNHYHAKTIQWTYVIFGRLQLVTEEPVGTAGLRVRELGYGELWRDDPGIRHAWRAIQDCHVLVFTRGPRAGSNYESDTFRLATPLIAS